MQSLFLCLAIFNASQQNIAKLSNEGILTACTHASVLISLSEKNNIDPLLIAALIWKESRWRPHAVSSAGACGLTQVIPKYTDKNCSDLKKPLTAISTGINSLKYWMTRKKLKEALACYNVGNLCSQSSRAKKYAKSVLKKQKWYKNWLKTHSFYYK